MARERMGSVSRAVRLVGSLAVSLLFGCGDPSGLELGVGQSPLIYGMDDRLEFYQVDDESVRLLTERSVVALVRRSDVDVASNVFRTPAQNWGNVGELCAGERFAEQPALALCTGVLLDWDLVLTGGHCARLYAPEDLAVLFGYYYVAPNTFASIGFGDLIDVTEIVSERLDPADTTDRLDYAWFRLARRAQAPRMPSAVYVAPPPIRDQDPAVVIGFGGGVPAKVDAGGLVQQRRESVLDFFVMDTDTSHASSGSPAFDDHRAVLGLLSRGGADLAKTDAGCNTSAQETDGKARAQEQFTYAHRAVAGLCQDAPGSSSLCRSDCDNPCAALAPIETVAAGCSTVPIAMRGVAGRHGFALGLVLLGICLRETRRRSTPPTNSGDPGFR